MSLDKLFVLFACCSVCMLASGGIARGASSEGYRDRSDRV